MNYVRKLGFEQAPDYDFLRELFSKVLQTLGEPDDGVFDWMMLNRGKASQRVRVGRSLPSYIRQVLNVCSGESPHPSPRASSPRSFERL